MDLPELGDATKTVKHKTKNLIPWLEDPFECPECGVFCNASRTYAPRQAAFYKNGMAPSWECPKCEREFYREEAWH